MSSELHKAILTAAWEGIDEEEGRELITEIRQRRLNPVHLDIEVKERIKLAREAQHIPAVQTLSPLLESLIVALEDCLQRIGTLTPKPVSRRARPLDEDW